MVPENSWRQIDFIKCMAVKNVRFSHWERVCACNPIARFVLHITFWFHQLAPLLNHSLTRHASGYNQRLCRTTPTYDGEVRTFFHLVQRNLISFGKLSDNITRQLQWIITVCVFWFVRLALMKRIQHVIANDSMLWIWMGKSTWTWNIFQRARTCPFGYEWNNHVLFYFSIFSCKYTHSFRFPHHLSANSLSSRAQRGCHISLN